MNGLVEVLCDPDMPSDWDEREARLTHERQAELALREPQLLEPEILRMFRCAALL